MEGLVKLYFERAENEIVLAESLFKISSNNNFKAQLGIKIAETFYSAVISHSYYSIFYCAKAILLKNNIKTEPPKEHKKTYNKFKQLRGIISKNLLDIYETESIKAESLLKIFFDEKKKRGEFTYKILPQANEEPARESLKNAGIFFKNINAVIENQDVLKKEAKNE